MMLERGQHWKPTMGDVVGCLTFVLLWLLPLLYQGLMNRYVPGMPRFIRYLHNSSCLFTHSVNHWRLDYLQVQLAADGEWLTLPEQSYFPMEPFGHDRTRLHRLMDLSLGNRPAEVARRQELAAWVRRRYMQLHPDQPTPVAVRIVWARQSIRRQAPEDRWRKPPLESFPPDQVYVLSTHAFGDRS